MNKVLTVGVFDYFHLGHLRVFEQAKSYGDYLIVAVQEESYIKKFKPEAQILYSLDERIEIISALKIVDEVVTYTSVEESVKNIQFGIFAVGEDQMHEGFKQAIKWVEARGKKVVRLKRTQGISSSDIKERINTNLKCSLIGLE